MLAVIHLLQARAVTYSEELTIQQGMAEKKVM